MLTHLMEPSGVLQGLVLGLILLHSSVRDFYIGITAPPAGSLVTLRCAVQWACWREGMDPEGPGQAGHVGLCEPLVFQQSEIQGPTPSQGNPQDTDRLGRWRAALGEGPGQ